MCWRRYSRNSSAFRRRHSRHHRKRHSSGSRFAMADNLPGNREPPDERRHDLRDVYTLRFGESQHVERLVDQHEHQRGLLPAQADLPLRAPGVDAHLRHRGEVLPLPLPQENPLPLIGRERLHGALVVYVLREQVPEIVVPLGQLGFDPEAEPGGPLQLIHEDVHRAHVLRDGEVPEAGRGPDLFELPLPPCGGRDTVLRHCQASWTLLELCYLIVRKGPGSPSRVNRAPLPYHAAVYTPGRSPLLNAVGSISTRGRSIAPIFRAHGGASSG